MAFFVAWLTLALLVGAIAQARGRHGWAWGLLAAVVSPIIAVIGLLALPNLSQNVGATARRFVRTIETAKRAANAMSKPTADLSADGVYAGIPYRVHHDGSIDAAMNVGVVRFKSMEHFLAAASGGPAPAERSVS